MRGVVSSDFIRIKMAEEIPPDKGQLVCVGELICPSHPKNKPLRKENQRITPRLQSWASTKGRLPDVKPFLRGNSQSLYSLMSRDAIVASFVATRWRIQHVSQTGLIKPPDY